MLVDSIKLKQSTVKNYGVCRVINRACLIEDFISLCSSRILLACLLALRSMGKEFKKKKIENM